MMRVMVRSNSLQLVRVEVVEKDWRGQGRYFGKMHLICLQILVTQSLEKKRLGMLCRSVFIRGFVYLQAFFWGGISRELSSVE